MDLILLEKEIPYWNTQGDVRVEVRLTPTPLVDVLDHRELLVEIG